MNNNRERMIRDNDAEITEMKLNPTMSGEHARILHLLRSQFGVPTYPEVIRKILEEFEGTYFVVITEGRRRQLQNMLQFSHLKYETGCLTIEDLMNWILLRGISLIKDKIGTIYDPNIRTQLDATELKVADSLTRTAYDPEWALGMTVKDLMQITRIPEDRIVSSLVKLIERGLVAEHPELKGHYFVLV